MAGFVTIISTAGSAEEAQKIANALVTRKLAACVQTLAINSCYMWEGRVNNDPEQLLLIKTREELFSAVEEAIKALHSYTTPEIICIPVIKGSKEYLAWITNVTNKD